LSRINLTLIWVITGGLGLASSSETRKALALTWTFVVKQVESKPVQRVVCHSLNRLFLARVFSPQKLSRMFKRLSVEFETVDVHDLIPGCHKIVQELFLGVGAGVDFGKGP
jgi:hypothetical protein